VLSAQLQHQGLLGGYHCEIPSHDHGGFSPMGLPPNPVAVPTVTHEYLFWLLFSEWLQSPSRWKAQGLLSGFHTPGTMGCWLRPTNQDTTDSLLWQIAMDPSTPYRIWAHHFSLKRMDQQPKKRTKPRSNPHQYFPLSR
jgi:hypothetical protein